MMIQIGLITLSYLKLKDKINYIIQEQVNKNQMKYFPNNTLSPMNKLRKLVDGIIWNKFQQVKQLQNKFIQKQQ